MKNWRTNLGGAISVTGTTLIGVGLLTQLSQLSPTSNMLTPHQLLVMWYVALIGFIFSAIGKGITALFAADARRVQSLQDQINQSTAVDSAANPVVEPSQKPPTTTPP